MKIRNTAFAASIVAVAVLFAPVYGPVIRARAASATTDDLGKDMKSVADVFALVEKNFADPVSSEKAFYGDQGRGGAIPGMLHTLDPHSNFVDPAEYREKAQDLAKRFEKNFETFSPSVSEEVCASGPKIR